MKRILFFILVVVTSVRGYSQTFYVNAISGNDAANGSEANPLLTLQKAVVLANQTILKEKNYHLNWQKRCLQVLLHKRL